VSLVLMILAHDAYFYWVHRLAHHRRLFRRVHHRHHLSHNPTPFTAYSFDLAEAVLMGSFVPLWVLLVPTQWVVVDLFVLHQIVRNTLLHCGIEVMPARADGRPLFDWLTTTTHHDLHHGQMAWNFGLYFTWWDRWMGTEHPRYHARFAAAVRHPRATASAAGSAT
jgi:sterol desaturase/sphingolipid hydroxylase (fatty acid hydroxylase superfamily)